MTELKQGCKISKILDNPETPWPLPTPQLSPRDDLTNQQSLKKELPVRLKPTRASSHRLRIPWMQEKRDLSCQKVTFSPSWSTQESEQSIDEFEIQKGRKGGQKYEECEDSIDVSEITFEATMSPENNLSMRQQHSRLSFQSTFSTIADATRSCKPKEFDHIESVMYKRRSKDHIMLLGSVEDMDDYILAARARSGPRVTITNDLPEETSAKRVFQKKYPKSMIRR